MPERPKLREVFKLLALCHPLLNPGDGHKCPTAGLGCTQRCELQAEFWDT